METKKKENRPRNKKRSDNTEMRKTPLETPPPPFSKIKKMVRSSGLTVHSVNQEVACSNYSPTTTIFLDSCEANGTFSGTSTTSMCQDDASFRVCACESVSMCYLKSTQRGDITELIHHWGHSIPFHSTGGQFRHKHFGNHFGQNEKQVINRPSHNLIGPPIWS